ncbi:hypothetical protein M405DRAFT_363139 [Rhizopogon salebrosus TDB-379]|nr:hypothetical protein M405DRAFT_363139 [Rhizopogon salebrosus TDB-379]
MRSHPTLTASFISHLLSHHHASLMTLFALSYGTDFHTCCTMQQEQIANAGRCSFKTGEKTKVASKRQAPWCKEGFFTRLTNCLKSLTFIEETCFTHMPSQNHYVCLRQSTSSSSNMSMLHFTTAFLSSVSPGPPLYLHRFFQSVQGMLFANCMPRRFVDYLPGSAIPLAHI